MSFNLKKRTAKIFILKYKVFGDWVNSLGRRFNALWFPLDSLRWVCSMVLDDSTPGTYGLWSSTGEVSLLAKTPRQLNSHLRNFSKRNLRLKASPEFLGPKSEQVVVAQNLMGAPSSAITKKPIRETKNAKTHTNAKVVGFDKVNWWLKDKNKAALLRSWMCEN